MKRKREVKNFNLDPQAFLTNPKLMPRRASRAKGVNQKDLGEMMFSTTSSNRLSLSNLFLDQPIFLILSGPSLNLLDLNQITSVGAMSFGVNNSWSIFKPSLWTCADHPNRFLYSRWRDPSVMKFCPLPLKNSKLRRKEGDKLVTVQESPGSCPNVFFYPRNLRFDPNTFLLQNSVNWGAESKEKDALGHQGARSVMFSALRISYLLGFRNIYLCGADFKMEEGKQNYAFPQSRDLGAIKGNNSSYKTNSKRLKSLNEVLINSGTRVWNCSPTSQLDAFPYLPFDQAIDNCRGLIPDQESSLGWYDKKKKKDKTKLAVKRN